MLDMSCDLETGTNLLEFGYENGKPTTITDPGFEDRTVTIHRDGDGKPHGIESADGVVTQLTIDENNQLRHIIYPGLDDPEDYTFEYDNDDGLITRKIEPAGNIIGHYFDETGRVDYTENQEGGRWTFPENVMTNGRIEYKTVTA